MKMAAFSNRLEKKNKKYIHIYICVYIYMDVDGPRIFSTSTRPLMSNSRSFFGGNLWWVIFLPIKAVN